MTSYRVWGPIGTGLEAKAYVYNAVKEVSLHRENHGYIFVISMHQTESPMTAV